MKHRWKRLPPLAEGEQCVKQCLTCGVKVAVGYGGFMYQARRSKRWDQSNSPHMRPCPGGRSS